MRTGLSDDHLLRPQAPEANMRLLLRVGGVFRWAVIGMVGVCAVVHAVPQPLPGTIVPWMAAAGLYAAVMPAASEKLAPGGAARMARALAAADLGALLALLAVYRGDAPDGFYIASALLLLEAAVVGGRWAAVAAGAALALAMGPLNFLSTLVVHHDITWQQMAEDAGALSLLAIAVAMSSAMLSAETSRAAPQLPQAAEAPAADALSAARLTNRERQVLSLMASGYSNLMIAERLHVTGSTVKGYVESIFARLNARNRAEAVAVAVRLGLILGNGAPAQAERSVMHRGR